MKIDYNKQYLLQLLEKQLSNFLISEAEMIVVESHLDAVLDRLNYCFQHNANKYYNRDGETYFNPFHSGQWAIFLYYYGNTIHRNSPQNSIVCDKIYYLNKMLNGCDILYTTQLPDIYMSDHPVGAVMGRGEFSDFFSFCQGCTVGNNNGLYPKFGEYVTMLADAKVIGNCTIGENVIIGANTYIKDEDIPAHSIVLGTSPNLIIKPNKIGKLNFK
jgi:serine O-acetyltransferase